MCLWVLLLPISRRQMLGCKILRSRDPLLAILGVALYLRMIGRKAHRSHFAKTAKKWFNLIFWVPAMTLITCVPAMTCSKLLIRLAMAISWGSVVVAAAALRLALIAYGEWQDANMEVPYTDIDYTVFSDASAFMAQGRSPYLRDTYRYSPLLAFVLLPNIWLHRCWGKLLFSSADLLVGFLIHRLLKLQRVPEDKCTLCVAAWLFNPFTFTIGTRGNCEALPCAVILLLTICLLQGRIFEAAVWYGLVVHFRIYPVIYALPFIFFLASAAGANERSDNSRAALLSYYRRILNRDGIIFGSVSGGVFLALTALSYKLYGMEFLNEALLYHLTRTDPRHNFSIYFYSIYLHQNNSFTVFERLLSFIPQMFIQVAFAIFYSRDLPFCLFIQTVAFVAFNKVVTAQYFVWFFCLLPLVLPFTSMRLKWEGAICMGVWTGAQLHWLAWAYFLEFKGKNVFLQLWLASCAFFAANVYVLAMILHHHDLRLDDVKKDL